MQVGAAAAVVLWAVLEAFWSLVVVASFGSPDSASRAKGGRERRRERDQPRIAVRVASRSFRKLALARDSWVPLETVTPADGAGGRELEPRGLRTGPVVDAIGVAVLRSGGFRFGRPMAPAGGHFTVPFHNPARRLAHCVPPVCDRYTSMNAPPASHRRRCSPRAAPLRPVGGQQQCGAVH